MFYIILITLHGNLHDTRYHGGFDTCLLTVFVLSIGGTLTILISHSKMILEVANHPFSPVLEMPRLSWFPQQPLAKPVTLTPVCKLQTLTTSCAGSTGMSGQEGSGQVLAILRGISVAKIVVSKVSRERVDQPQCLVNVLDLIHGHSGTPKSLPSPSHDHD